SSPPVTTPPPAYATPRNGAPWGNVASTEPSSTRHSLAFPSSLAVSTRSLPTNDARVTGPPCRSTRTTPPSLQIPAVPSALALTSERPSGLNCTVATGPSLRPSDVNVRSFVS